MEGEILTLFGLDLETMAMISAIVYYVVEAVKGKFTKVFVGGPRTDVLALILSMALSFKIYGMAGQWESFVVCGFLCWLIPAGFHKKSNGGKK